MPYTKYKIPNTILRIPHSIYKWCTATRLRKLLSSVLAVLILLTSIRFIFFNKEIEAAWYSDTWAYRKKLTIDYTKVSGSADLINFPVLVSFTDSSLTKAQSDGDDILFTSSDGTSKLDHDLEKFDQVAGTIVAWVEIPTLSYTANTSIYMYYGNTSATSQENETDTWNDDYVSVYHFSEASGAHDDTQGSNNSDYITVTQQGADIGKVYRADEFNGSTDYVRVPDDDTLSFSGDYTVEAWVKFDQLAVAKGTDNGIVNKTNSASPYIEYGLEQYASGGTNYIRFFTQNSAATEYDANASGLSTDTWYHVVGTKTSNITKIYINGSSTTGDTFSGSVFNSNSTLRIGDRGGQKFTDGIIDEIRISSTSRTDGWITTTYNTVNSPSTFFASRGDEERQRVPVLVFHFDEGYGETANDSGTQQNNGTLAGATKPTWQSEDMCVSGKCLYFNGSTASVTVSNTVHSIQSVSFWVKPKTNGETLVDLDGGTHYISASSGTISATGFTDPTIYVNGQASKTFTANVWNHIVVTTGTAFDATSIKIGDVSSSFLNGFVDEFKLYDYDRTAAQVKSDYAGKSAQLGVSTSFGPDQSWLSNGLIGYWKMDETSGDASDASGNGNTLTNNGTATFTSGKFGNGSEHIPASTQYFVLSGDTAYDYCFDESDTAAYSTMGTWNNPSNGFDCDTGTYTDASGGLMNILVSTGSNSPTSGDTISTVEVRTYGYSSTESDSYTLSIYTDETFSEELGSIINYSNSLNWSDYATLSAPTGGWTWQKVNDLTTRHVAAGNTYYIYENEVRVTISGTSTISGVKSVSFWTNPDTLTNYYVSLTSGAYITSNSSGILSATGFTNPKIYVNGAQGTTITANTWQLVTITSETAIDADQFYIGRQGDNYFDGTIDEIRLHNRVLSPVEVSQLYNWAPGPLAYYKFDEGTGTSSTNDSSGNGYTGTMNGSMTSQDWVNGKFGKALDFDGSDDYIESGSSQKIDSSTAGTVTAWFKTNSISADQSVFAYGGATTTNAGSFDVGIENTTGSSAYLTLYQASNGDGTTDSLRGSTLLSTNTWYHAAWVSDGSAYTFYLNGVKETLTAISGSNTGDWLGDTTVSETDHTQIGERYRNSTRERRFNGIIDEAKVYNYDRTQEQIIEDMNAGHPAPGSPVGSALLQLKFDEGYGDTANDSGTGANNGNLATSVYSCPGSTYCPTWTNEGKYGKALNFDGSDDKGVYNDTHAGVLSYNLTDLTISTWVKVDTFGDAEYIVHSGETGSETEADNDNYFLRWDTTSGNDIEYGHEYSTGSDEYHIFDTNLSADTWYHIVLTRNLTTNTLNLYINGNLVGAKIFTNDPTGGAGGEFAIGCDDDTTGGYFDGTIDEFYIYSSDLTADQVKLLYNQGSAAVWGASSTDSSGNASWSANNEYCPPGQGSACTPPIAEWKFDENTGTTYTYDSSGNGYTGNLWYNPRWSPGKYGSALYFSDQTNDPAVGIADNSFDTLSSGTISMWVKVDGTGDSWQDFFGLGASTDWWEMSYDRSTTPDSFAVSAASSGCNLDISASIPDPVTGWHHVVFTEGASDNDLYIDGIRLAGDSTNCFFSEWDPGGSVYYTIGCWTDDGTACFDDEIYNGYIDDVRIYNYARTPAQVAWEYNRGVPVGWWKLDENQTGDGQTAYDSSGNDNHGTTEGGTGNLDCTVTGKYNTACDFDGGDDYINAGSDTTLDDIDTITLTAWIKPTGFGESSMGRIADKGTHSATSTEGWALFVDNAGASCTNCLSFFQNFGATYYGWWNTPDNSISTETWQHVAVIYNKTSATNKPIMYINGVPQLIEVYNAPSGTASDDSSNNLIIGNRSESDRTFDGLIDEVKVFNYTLTPQQILNDFNEGSAIRFGP